MIKQILTWTLMAGCIGGTAFAQTGTDTWSLDRCLEYAQQSNIPLKQAQLDLDRNKALLSQSQAAKHPNLNSSLSGSYNAGLYLDPFTNTLQNQNIGNANINLLSTRVTLYNGGRLNNSIKRDDLNLQASQFNLEQQNYDLSLQVASAYLSVLQRQELLGSAQFQLETTVEQRNRTEKLVKAGSLAPADLLQLESQIATEELNVVNAENQLKVTYLNLMQVLNLEPTLEFEIEQIEVPEPPVEFDAPSLSELYATAQTTQPVIQALDKSIEAAEYDVKVAKAGTLPSVVGFGDVNTGYSSSRRRQLPSVEAFLPLDVRFGESNEVETIFVESSLPQSEEYPFINQLGDNISATVGVSLQIPIYNRRQNKTAIELSQISMENSRLTAQQTVQTLKQNIQQAYVDAKSAHSNYKAAKRNFDAAELNLQNVEKQFELGVANSVDYLVAKNTLNMAKVDMVRTKFTYAFTRVVLEFYMGEELKF
ncbi:TolC family protein [Pontibacter sp. G13]|uniref:TolC family protein n=1 Tax=Pontibacter sp. G13 TaxID=3074898 RepID=UPI00288B1928|nr:TolC family protein [Pontibacter sp. G13]WNJ21288.1 TolC family protein [Pontibacter sp. G13]